MNPFMVQMMMWQQGVEMIRKCITAQTEFNIRMIEVMAGGVAPRSAGQLARDAEALRRAEADAKPSKPATRAKSTEKASRPAAKAAPRAKPDRSGGSGEGARVH